MAASMAARKAATAFALGAFALMALMHATENLRPASAPSPARAPALSPLGLAAEYVTVDVTGMRWLWWPAILYLFWGMAYVCDVYFVRTIEVISERFEIPDDVAGATLMALGCNGPEMALNTIAIFHPSNIGVGAVVGGEVFNVLVIIGTALLATPDMYMPLKLGKFNFFRDVIFYMISVALLYWVLKDGMISRLNAAVLLVGAVCYVLVVVYSSKIASAFATTRLLRSATRTLTHPRLSLTAMFKLSGAADADEESDEDEEADAETIERWAAASSCADPSAGSLLSVHVDVRNRLMDRGQKAHLRYMWLREDALVVSTLVDPAPGMTVLKRNNSGIVYDHDEDTHDHHWHHGGLVNQPLFLDEHGHPKLTNGAQGAGQEALARPLLNDVSKKPSEVPANGELVPPPFHVAGFKDAPWEIIPLEDILYCEHASVDQKHFNLHVHQHDSHLGNMITIELSTPEVKVMEAWMVAIRQKLLEQRRSNIDAPEAKSCVEVLMEWVDWLQFPVKWCVARSIPDMDNPKLQHLYPVSFCMSMVWLAIFAFSVVKACDGIHNDFGISDDVLGFTVAAAGTSFPNVFSGMCVARQGKTSMAIANALGANVQNVFLALAVPWTIQSVFLVGGPFPMAVNNLLPAILECAITLSPVVLVYIFCSFSMPRWSGGLFLLTYVVYLIFALGQQISKCPVWPLRCE